ncbi:MAG: hypothetical protein JSS57_15150 [Proteobacteria bacterium]|nr:hypothetical protein [Pseudomonadota bacterium]
MQMRPEIQITSVIKAVKDVLIPAIAPNNKLAVEQAQLVIGLLSLLASQLPLQFRFDRDELSRLLATAEALGKIRSDNPALANAMNQLATSRLAGAGVLQHCQLDPAELVGCVRELREKVGAVVTAAAGSDDLDVQLHIEKLVLEMSKEQLLRDRSLVKAQGWEPDPAALPDIGALLAGTAAAA